MVVTRDQANQLVIMQIKQKHGHTKKQRTATPWTKIEKTLSKYTSVFLLKFVNLSSDRVRNTRGVSTEVEE